MSCANFENMDPDPCVIAGLLRIAVCEIEYNNGSIKTYDNHYFIMFPISKISLIEGSDEYLDDNNWQSNCWISLENVSNIKRVRTCNKECCKATIYYKGKPHVGCDGFDIQRISELLERN